MIKKCPGCGATLQYSDENKIGFSPKKDAKLCERCFKLKNYNQKKIIDLKYSNDDIINLLNSNADNVLFITDFLNLSQNVINIYKSLKVDNKALIINKTDYIPKSINKEKYINWIKDIYRISGSVVLASAEKDYNIRVINNLLLENKKNYICGFTNSGKSSIINKLGLLNNKNTSILTSLMPNTTLDIIKIKLGDNKYIFDTPGFVSKNEFDEKLHPKKFLKPITLQLKPNDIVSINNQIFIKSDKDNSLTFYMSNDLNIKKVFNNDLSLDNKIKINDNSELLIDGYGFINIKKSCMVKTNLDNQKIEIRTSMF